MDWVGTTESTITNENDSLDLSTNQHGNHHHHHHHHQHQHNHQPSDILLPNEEFNNLNTQCIDTNLNLNLSQLNQLYHLNSQEDKLRNDSDDNLESLILNQSDVEARGRSDGDDVQHNNNSNRLTSVPVASVNVKDSSNSKAVSTSIQLANVNNNTSSLFILSDPNNAESFNIFTLNCIPIPKKDNEVSKTLLAVNTNSNTSTTAIANNTNKDASHQPVTSGTPVIPKKLTINRYNYKCKYCPFITKFKAHIIEHMFKSHKINLMQCPELTCAKTFKDEWKLKRHLLSNRDHKPLPNFKNLSDVMKQYVEVTPQKLGFPCPLCQFDSSNNLITQRGDDGEAQMFVANDLAGKNMDNFLFLDTYEHLKTHVLINHTKFDLESYFICKQCGQVFINRYKLSCHLFNVHSGKRKRRPTVASKLLANKNDNRMMLLNNSAQPQQFVAGSSMVNNEWNINETISNVISGQHKGKLFFFALIFNSLALRIL
jgi:hypothetical protein